MRNAFSLKESRSTRIKHYLIATIFAYRVFIVLFLIVPTSTLAGPVNLRPECDIGRSPIDAQPGHTFATGMVGEPGRIQHFQAAMAALDESPRGIRGWRLIG